jgi:hypothetical protein
MFLLRDGFLKVLYFSLSASHGKTLKFIFQEESAVLKKIDNNSSNFPGKTQYMKCLINNIRKIAEIDHIGMGGLDY